MAMIRTTAFSMNPCVLLPMMMMIMVSYQWGGQIGMVSAADHNVGGSSDWALGVDYSDWASTQTFSVGDNLVFTWSGNHDVVVVSKSDYDACTSASSDNKSTSSPTTIQLTAAGTTYYICSITGHCTGGMKLAVTASASATSTSNSTTPTSSTPSTPTSSTPTSSTSSTPSSPNSSPSMFPSISTMLIVLGASLVATIL